MKILMLGWEFPPYFAGGVGMVCFELAKELSKYQDIDIDYIMPYFEYKDKKIHSNFNILNASIKRIKNLNLIKINSLLNCYQSSCEYKSELKKVYSTLEKNDEIKDIKQIYGENLLEEVYLYSLRVLELAKNKYFDLIHAHDWTTVPAAIALKKITGKPFIFHVHITEFDKTGGNGGYDEIIKIEREGFKHADKIIAVSNFTKQRLITNYGVDEKKIVVIHNGGVSDLKIDNIKKELFKTGEKIVLFAGRMTLQKGPEYFLYAAKKVLEYDKNVKFILAGSGDMLERMIELSAELGISKNVLFFGKYTREQADDLFAMADVFVMPSVSEPFGIVPLEALAKGTPVIISKQSGISEVLSNVFKVDFWDTELMADRILSLLKYKTLKDEMSYLSSLEFRELNWEKPTQKIISIYNNLISKN